MGLTSAFAWISNFINSVFFLLKGKKMHFFQRSESLGFPFEAKICVTIEA